MMNRNPEMKKLTANIKLGHYKFDESVDYELEQDCDWVNRIFDELEDEVDRSEKDYQKGFLKVDLKLKRKSGKPFGDHLLVRGHISTEFMCPCVRCLKLTQQKIEADIKVAFIPSTLESEPEFEELDEIFTENEEFALYFHEKGSVDIAEMVHENVFMEIDHFPLHNLDCQGLCHECGHNLNEGPCPKHGPKLN